MMKCTQCGSTQIVANLRVLDQVSDSDKSDLAIEANLSPQSLFVADSVSIPMIANVCIDCGNVMFAIRDQADLEKIKQAALNAQAMHSEGLSEGEENNPSIGFGAFLGEDSKS